jgi:hypothetical protein
MTHKNNHARSKQKRKKLRLKNRLKAIWERLISKRHKQYEEKGHTIKGVRAADVAVYVRGMTFFDTEHPLRRNQRQKRKKWRNSPHTRPSR